MHYSIEAHKREQERLGDTVSPFSPPPIAPAALAAAAPRVEVSNTFSPRVQVSPTVSPTVSPVVSPKTTVQPVANDRWKAQTGLPTIDLTERLAAEHNVLISAKRDSGKTTALRAAIRHRYEELKGHCEFWIADPKNSEFLGLEKTPNYLFVNDENIADLVAFLDAAHRELKRRIRVRGETRQPTQDPTLTIVLDEWLSLLAYCEDDKAILQEVKKKLKILAVQGREDRVNVWLCTHSHLVQDCGLSTTIRDNFAVYALGRQAPGKASAMESVQAAISDQYLTRDQSIRTEFMDRLREHRASECPVMYCSTDGGVLCQLPDLREFTDWQYPIAPIAVDFEIDLEKLQP